MGGYMSLGPNYIGNISERHSKIAGDLFSTGSLQLATENMGTLSSTDEELIRDTAMGNIADILEEQFGTTLAYTTAIELSQDLQIDDLIILAEEIKDNSVQENLEIIPKEARALSPEDLEDIIGWSVESTEDSAAAQELINSARNAFLYDVDDNIIAVDIEAFLREVGARQSGRKRQLMNEVFASYLYRQLNNNFLFTGKDFRQRVYDYVQQEDIDSFRGVRFYVLNRYIDLIIPEDFDTDIIGDELGIYQDIFTILRVLDLSFFVEGESLIEDALKNREEWTQTMTSIINKYGQAIGEWITSWDPENNNLHNYIVRSIRDNYIARTGNTVPGSIELIEFVTQALERETFVEDVLIYLNIYPYYTRDEIITLKETRSQCFRQIHNAMIVDNISIEDWILNDNEDQDECQRFIVREIERIFREEALKEGVTIDRIIGTQQYTDALVRFATAAQLRTQIIQELMGS
jgi:hypothetical protein